MNIKPMRTIIYLPLMVKDGQASKFVKNKQVGMIDFVDIKVGDMFTIDKKPNFNVPVEKWNKHKVVSVTYSIMDRGNIVELEPKEFKTIEDLERF